MSEIKTRADLFEAAAKMMRMCDEAGVPNAYKIKGMLYIAEPKLNLAPDVYEFPLAILEGRPVFVGDEVFSVVGDRRIKVNEFDGHNIYGKDALNGQNVVHAKGFLSWNPPKPRTVIVEMLREDAERMCEFWKTDGGWMGQISTACRKALKSSK